MVQLPSLDGSEDGVPVDYTGTGQWAAEDLAVEDKNLKNLEVSSQLDWSRTTDRPGQQRTRGT